MMPQSLKLLIKLVTSGLYSIAFSQLVVSAHVYAINSGRLNAYPTGQSVRDKPWFTYAIPAGGTKADSITVTNLGSTVESISLYPVDAALAGVGSGLAMQPQNSLRQDIGAWVHLNTQSIIVNPHSSRQVGFKLNIPRRASVGDHYGGIIIQPKQTAAALSKEGVHIRILPRLGIRIYETVPGRPQPNLSVSSLHVSHHGHSTEVMTVVQNTGNSLLSPFGKITVHSTFGRTVTNRSVAVGHLFQPGQTYTVRTTFPVSNPILQRYHVTAVIQYGSRRTIRRQTSFWVINTNLWRYGTILVFLGIAYYLRRRFRGLKCG